MICYVSSLFTVSDNLKEMVRDRGMSKAVYAFNRQLLCNESTIVDDF